MTSTLTKSFVKLSLDHRCPMVLIMGIFDYKSCFLPWHFCLCSGPDLVLNLYLTPTPKIGLAPLPTSHKINTQQARTYICPDGNHLWPTSDGRSAQDIVGDRKIFECDRLICPQSGATQCRWPRARRGSYLSPPTQVQSHAVVPS